jgi:hypothetical protein
VSNDKTHAEMVAAVASNYAKEACAATQGVIEAVRGHAPGIGTCVDCGQSLSACECPDELYEAAFNQALPPSPGIYKAALWSWGPEPLLCAFARDTDGTWWFKPPHAYALPLRTFPKLVIGERVGDVTEDIIAQAKCVFEEATDEILRREKQEADEATFNQEPCARCEDERGDCGGHSVVPSGYTDDKLYALAHEATAALTRAASWARSIPPTCDRCEAILAENYKLVAKVSELQVAIEFLRSQKPVSK